MMIQESIHQLNENNNLIFSLNLVVNKKSSLSLPLSIRLIKL